MFDNHFDYSMQMSIGCLLLNSNLQVYFCYSTRTFDSASYLHLQTLYIQNLQLILSIK